jgi:hypothetical protein
MIDVPSGFMLGIIADDRETSIYVEEIAVLRIKEEED